MIRPLCRLSSSLATCLHLAVDLHAARALLPFSPRSLLVVATSLLLSQLVAACDDLHRHHPDLQVVAAAVDTLPNGTLDGYSTLWHSEHMDIPRSTRLDAVDDLNAPIPASDGVTPVVARKNWKMIPSGLTMAFATPTEPLTATVQLANTVFNNGSLTTLFYLQPPGLADPSNNLGHMLASAEVAIPELPVKWDRVVAATHLTPLYTEHDGLVVTLCRANLVKAINNQPASDWLQNCAPLMALASKETQVFATVRSGEHPPRQFQVVAGGGSWGAKANILVLLPEAQLREGDVITFSMLTPEVLQTKGHGEVREVASDASRPRLVFECSFEEEGFPSHGAAAPSTIDGVFSMGSTSGVTLNGRNHKSGGEMVVVG